MIPQRTDFLARFRRDESGAVLPMFGVTSLVLFLSAGIAIDFGLAHQAKTKLGDAADAAVLATAKAVREQNLTKAQAEAYLDTFFKANLGPQKENFAVVTGTQPKINMNTGAVELKVQAKVDTIFGSIAGIDFWNVPVTSVALIEGKDIEIGLQLDVTGSMGTQDMGGGQSRMTVMKQAAKDLVDIVISDTLKSQKVRLGIAPFASGVNAGTFAASVNGNRSDTCTYERLSTSYQSTEATPDGSAALKVRADLTGASACPTATVEPMTDDKTKLKSKIDSFAAAGVTAGHLGTAWAWYLISPQWNNVWPGNSKPAPYNDGKTIKVAILMTDGEYNTIGGRNVGGNQSNTFAKDTCEAMKAKQITVYTVGVGGDIKGNAKSVLEDCATDTGKFYLALNAEEVRAAFRSIAQDITTLRLTK